MIELKSVRKDYNSEVSIGPVDLQIPAGGITALVGPNGAGKSTLLTIIGRLLGADSGSIEIAGYDIARTPSKDLAKIVSILRQENHFVTRLTVRQLVGDPAMAIKHLADEVDARLLVVGTRKRGFGESVREFFTGSVGARLAHRQHRPILVVPLGEPVPDDEEIWPS